jgi:thiol-disulfide isomerase/thioredoxin
MKRISAMIAASFLLFSASASHAVVEVGQQAKLSFKTVDGKSVDLEQMHGKIIVVDFWATWCGPCMNEAAHMVSINEKYGSKGLQFLGVSLDNDKEKMLSVAKSKGFTWPQYFDGMGWDNALWKQWGANGIPFTVLVDANGKVVYVGHPAGGLDAAIETAFKTTPPFLVDPSVVAAAMKLLDQVEQKLGSRDASGALKLLAKVPPEVSSDDKFAQRSQDVKKKLVDVAEGLLADAGTQATAGNYLEAIRTLRDLVAGLTGLDVAAKAKKQLADLLDKSEVKAAIAKADKAARDAEREAIANAGLTVARKFQADGKHDLAYAKFKQVAADYAGSASAATAAEQVKVYDKEHPELAQGEKDAVVGGKAKAALSMAESYKNSGNYDLAKAKYRSIIATYPRTEYAETAKQELLRMGQ